MTSILIEETLDELDSEELAVRSWRRDQFGRLGFDSVIARLLAESPADLGLARRLRRSGCPVALAFRILAYPRYPSPMPGRSPSERTRVKREPQRGAYDR